MDAFRQRYERMVGRGTAREDAPVEVVNLGVQVVRPGAAGGTPRPCRPGRPGRRGPAPPGSTAPGCPARCTNGATLGAGQAIEGPAFVESAQSTVVVYPGQTAVVDQFANIRIAQP